MNWISDGLEIIVIGNHSRFHCTSMSHCVSQKREKKKTKCMILHSAFHAVSLSKDHDHFRLVSYFVCHTNIVGCMDPFVWPILIPIPIPIPIVQTEISQQLLDCRYSEMCLKCPHM